jgi:D-alanyl-lipoteichoic acid acyltransferase DltB (MBOAT superfamily)
MVFTSLNFLLFFPLLAIVYYITPGKFRWITLLVASYFFYINIKPAFALLVSGVTLSTYIFTRLIDKAGTESGKKTLMVINIVLILLPLFFFKYFAVINNGILSLLDSYKVRWPLPEIKLLLPVGISFYTFMAIGYTIDVSNEEIKSEKNIGIVALFLSFFPLILSGPIERANNMLPQFKKQINLDFALITQGIKLMLWGYFMKLVVADRIGIYVDAVYGNIGQHNGTSLVLASMLYSIQLYADFGGYSIIAIGTAKILGIDVMQNFKRPFFATSMSEFWRRWHISLISWLTDYVYTPLSFTFRKFKIWGIVIAIMITFLISGIWHGAGLTFIIWGLIQGSFLSIEALTNKGRTSFQTKYNLNKRIWYIVLSCIVTFVLFSASMVFGRAKDLNDALMVYSKIFSGIIHIPYRDGYTMMYSFIGFTILILKEFRDEYYPDHFLLFENKNVIIRWLSYYAVIFMILYYGVFGQEKFIYFQY